MNLELAAMRWLWLEKRCHYVLEQRTPIYHLGQPDVLGVTASRHLIEIEIKRSVSDFRADFKKRHRINRDSFLSKQAKLFFYLTDTDLGEKILSKIPEWAGLIVCKSKFKIEVIKNAPVNLKSERLSIKECVKLARCITNHTMSYAHSIHTQFSQFKHRDSQCYVEWYKPENGTYEI